MEEKEIGSKIKRLRTNMNMTLRLLSEKTGLTEGYLSRIENSESAPPISTLLRIAHAFSIDISYFFSSSISKEGAPPSVVINRSEQLGEREPTKRGYAAAKGYYYYRALAAEKSKKNMSPFLLIPTFEFGEVIKADGECFFYVLSGSVEFLYGADKYSLSKGDSMYFDWNVPFTAKSVGGELAELLVVVYPYKRG